MNKQNLKRFKIGLLLILFLLFWFFDFKSPIQEIIVLSVLGTMWIAELYVKKKNEIV